MMAKEEILDFIIAVLHLQEDYDCYGGPLFWRVRGGLHWPVGSAEEPVTFWVLCNDLFWWATADAEQLTARDLPVLRQAIEDIQAVWSTASRLAVYERACELWCARKRQMRPQRPFYQYLEAEVWPLFDACGPERSPKEEG